MECENPVLVIGGTRGTGLLIARLLHQRNYPVRVLARDPARANKLSICDLESGNELAKLEGLEAPAEAVALSPEANYAAAANASDIIVWNGSNSKALHQLRGHTT